MLFRKILLAVLLLFSICNYAQNKTETIQVDLPKSIFTSPLLAKQYNSPFEINQRLNLNSYKFVRLDEKSIEEGCFSIPLQNFTETPSKFIYDTYQKIFHNLDLKKSFFKVAHLYKMPFKKPQ